MSQTLRFAEHISRRTPPVNNRPFLSVPTWVGFVGKEPDKGGEEPVPLDELCKLFSMPAHGAHRIEMLDIFCFMPHVDFNNPDTAKLLGEAIFDRYGFFVGTLVAPTWAGTNGGSAMTIEGRVARAKQIKKTAEIGKWLREQGIRPAGCNLVRTDTGESPENFMTGDTKANAEFIAETFRMEAEICADLGERLTVEGEPCQGGMQTVQLCADIMRQAGSKHCTFEADLTHINTMMMAPNGPEGHRLLPEGTSPDNYKPAELLAHHKWAADQLGAHTGDLHIGQSDFALLAGGSHLKTGHHCTATDPKGVMDLLNIAGFWMLDANGQPNRKFEHILWDGCMFLNSVIRSPITWQHILMLMVAIREYYGWKVED